MTEPNSRFNGKTWLVGILAVAIPILVTMGGAGAIISWHVQAPAHPEAQHAIGALEAEVENNEKGIERVERQLEYIHKKLDRLLEAK